MTLRELSSEICALGFDDYLKLDASIVFAAKRALSAIYGELRITSRATLQVVATAPSRKVDKFHHNGGREETLPLSGKAYAMTVSGKGSVRIYDGANSKTVSFDSDSKLIKGFLHSAGKAVFHGDYSYNVYNIATYDEAFGDDLSAIPDGRDLAEICVRDRLSDFLAFSSPPLDSKGRPIGEVQLKDGIITLPACFEGDLNITYRRCPAFPSLSSPDEPIDIPREYETLLPLLSAFYILLDEDAEKAEIYKKAYLEMLDSIKKSQYSVTGTGYANVTGW